MAERSCGSCHACCIAPALPQLSKPCWEPCQNLRPGSGCSIYQERPAPCRTFRCAWLCDPGMPDEFRPDRCGIMLVGRPNNVLQVWEVGADWEGSPLQSFLSKFDHKMRVRVAFKAENADLIDAGNVRSEMANGRGEINLKYTITLPKGH